MGMCLSGKMRSRRPTGVIPDQGGLVSGFFKHFPQGPDLRSQSIVGLQTVTHHAPVPAQARRIGPPLKKSSSTANPAAPAYRENFANLSTKYGVRLKRITASL